MSTQPFDEALHPRKTTGKFASKNVAEVRGGMEALGRPVAASKLPDGGLTATLGASRLTFVRDHAGSGIDDEDNAYSTFDAIRPAGERRHRIASITVYDDADATIGVNAGVFEPTTASMSAQARLVDAIAKSDYRVGQYSPGPYRGRMTRRG